jgi:ABC-type cobalamin/Fe3+-siderophores transport system ATPase subunit
MFTRTGTNKWHDDVPGARWFKGDLHLHTLDDHPSANLIRPQGCGGSASEPAVQTVYARAFLQSAILKGIEVLGLTPHAVKAGADDDSCAVWRIVDLWNSGVDDDGVPFREKIYAVFPGFEPNLVDGSDGVHLLFLFDPEIGRSSYLEAFAAVMGAIPPWRSGTLQISSLDPTAAFTALHALHERSAKDWDYMCLAPHAFSAHGLFTLRSQVLQAFPHHFISGLELKDNWLIEDAFADKPWLKDGLKEHRHALFHSSDAYSVGDIGKRFTLFKLAQPRICALRQSLLASDSRMRIVYRKQDGQLLVRADLPDPKAGDRPWLRLVTVKGGTSFFAGTDKSTGQVRQQTFHFNPDLTCVIGGRMSGKSTLLDGLRVHCAQPLPDEADVRTDVERRARDKFLSGTPAIVVDIRGPLNPTIQLRERWPARFFTQRELQKAVRDQKIRRQILFRIIPSESALLVSRADRIAQLDGQLIQLAKDVELARTHYADAIQALAGVEASKRALDRFAAAGVAKLTAAQADQGRLDAAIRRLTTTEDQLEELTESSCFVQAPSLSDTRLQNLLAESGTGRALEAMTRRYRAAIRYAQNTGCRIRKRLEVTKSVADEITGSVRGQVEAAVVAAGGSSEDLNQFDALTRSAAELEVRRAKVAETNAIYKRRLRALVTARRERSLLVREQRTAMDRVAALIAERFPDRIRVQKNQSAEIQSLEKWVLSLREPGVTRWWNTRKTGAKPVTPELLCKMWKMELLSALQMSDQVALTFGGLMTPLRRFELYALRNEDRYDIELKIGETNEFRELGNLSGGAQVSVLLSLVLETDDSEPLIVDQPEDELDKAFLFETLLPALRRLKGRRQVIFATHDANIVVNGDADQVIYLQADQEFGRVVQQGTIDQTEVKDAIVRILDGGRDAFTLRQAKYGF